MYLNGKVKFFILCIFKRECPPTASPGRFGNWNTPPCSSKAPIPTYWQHNAVLL